MNLNTEYLSSPISFKSFTKLRTFFDSVKLFFSKGENFISHSHPWLLSILESEFKDKKIIYILQIFYFFSSIINTYISVFIKKI